MLRLCFTSFLLLCSLILSAQGSFIVAGKVIDGNSKQPLSGSSVFCQNTTIGTITNADGDFRLSLNNGGYDLVISFTGYETQSFHINSATQSVSSLSIELKPKEKSLEEVAIVASNEVKDGWVKYGQFFVDNFIGKTQNSKQCTLQNPESLKFYFSKKRNRLKVLAKEDLVIQNKALGYKIRYQLDSFVYEYGGDRSLYAGYPFFEEMQGSSEQAEQWKKNREIAYNGSLLQFMRSYHDSTLKKDGYKVELINDKTDKTSALYNPYDSSVFTQVDSNKVELFFPGKLRVVYSLEKPEPAYLESSKLPLNTPVEISILDLNDSIIIEENGYFFDQKDILTLGYWAWEKMGDFLPYDYYPNRNQ